MLNERFESSQAAVQAKFECADLLVDRRVSGKVLNFENYRTPKAFEDGILDASKQFRPY